MVKVLNLLPEDEVLEQGRASITRPETVLVADRASHIRCQEGIIVVEVELAQELLGRTSCVLATVKLVRLVLWRGSPGLTVHEGARRQDGGETCREKQG